MKKEVMEVWVKALRSGDYKQCQRRLKSDSGAYCCLGVLCEIHGKETDKPEDRWFEGHALPERDVVEWAGMKDNMPRTLDGIYLTDLNDTGASFVEIANITEKHYEEL